MARLTKLLAANLKNQAHPRAFFVKREKKGEEEKEKEK